MDYKKIYDDLISKARSENRIKNDGVYYEAHHIIPKCLGGEGKVNQWRTHPNIILLTAKEHFVAHKLLCDIYPNEIKLKYALNAMCLLGNKTKRYYNSSKEFQRIKLEINEFQAKNMLGNNNPNYGNNWTKEQKKKLANKRIGKLNPMYGQKRLDHSKKMLGSNNPASKLNDIQIDEIISKYNSKQYTQIILAKEYNVSRFTISRIIKKSR